MSGPGPVQRSTSYTATRMKVVAITKTGIYTAYKVWYGKGVSGAGAGQVAGELCCNVSLRLSRYVVCAQ